MDALVIRSLSGIVTVVGSAGVLSFVEDKGNLQSEEEKFGMLSSGISFPLLRLLRSVSPYLPDQERTKGPRLFHNVSLHASYTMPSIVCPVIV